MGSDNDQNIIEVVNLFGKLTLDATVKEVIQKIITQTEVVDALGVILNAINNKLNTVDTGNISGSVTVNNFPTDLSKESSVVDLKNLSNDIKGLITNIKDTVQTKIVKQDTDNIKGDVSVSNLPNDLATNTSLTLLKDINTDIKTLVGSIKDLVQANNVITTAINNKILKQDTDNIKGDVNINNFPGLTNDDLRTSPVSVLLSETFLPDGAATETTMASLLLKVDSVLNKINSSLIKSNSDEVNIGVGDIRLLAALRANTRMSYDGSNNLRVTNAPTGTQTVSIATTGNTIQGSINILGMGSYATSHVLNKLSFYKIIDRITIT